MGSNIDDYKKENKDKMKIGSCVELICLLDSFDSDFNRLKSCIQSNDFLLNNQDLDTLFNGLEGFRIFIEFYIFSILNDIDNSQDYCKYLHIFY